MCREEEGAKICQFGKYDSRRRLFVPQHLGVIHADEMGLLHHGAANVDLGEYACRAI